MEGVIVNDTLRQLGEDILKDDDYDKIYEEFASLSHEALATIATFDVILIDSIVAYELEHGFLPEEFRNILAHHVLKVGNVLGRPF